MLGGEPAGMAAAPAPAPARAAPARAAAAAPAASKPAAKGKGGKAAAAAPPPPPPPPVAAAPGAPCVFGPACSAVWVLVSQLARCFMGLARGTPWTQNTGRVLLAHPCSHFLRACEHSACHPHPTNCLLMIKTPSSSETPSILQPFLPTVHTPQTPNTWHAAAHADDPRPFEEELKAREAALGPDHPDVAESCSNLAILYNQKGDAGARSRRPWPCATACLASCPPPLRMELAGAPGTGAQFRTPSMYSHTAPACA